MRDYDYDEVDILNDLKDQLINDGFIYECIYNG